MTQNEPTPRTTTIKSDFKKIAIWAISAIGIMFLLTSLFWILYDKSNGVTPTLPFIVIDSILLVLAIILIAIYYRHSQVQINAEIHELRAENKLSRDMEWSNKDTSLRDTVSKLSQDIRSMESRLNTESKSENLVQLHIKFMSMYITSMPDSECNKEMILNILKGNDEGYKEIAKMIDKLK